MKYSLRSLMIVMLIVAICAGWWSDRQRLADENMRLKKEVERLGEQTALDERHFDRQGLQILVRLPRKNTP
jgi:hypothetical protein